MPIPSQRTVVADEVKNLGTLENSEPIETLTQVQNDSYDRFLQAGTKVWNRSCARSSRLKATTDSIRSITSAMSWASHGTRRWNAGSCG